MANQVEALREVGLQGWEVVAEYLDEGISGTRGRERRLVFDAVLRAVTRREWIWLRLGVWIGSAAVCRIWLDFWTS